MKAETNGSIEDLVQLYHIRKNNPKEYEEIMKGIKEISKDLIRIGMEVGIEIEEEMVK